MGGHHEGVAPYISAFTVELKTMSSYMLVAGMVCNIIVFLPRSILMRDLNTTTLMIKTKIDPQYNKYCSPVTGTGLAKIGGLYTETVHNSSV